MTTETSHQCPTCGTALAKPAEAQPPEPARKAYMIEYYAPAGVCRDIITAHSPQEAIEQAKKQVETAALKDIDFDPLAESYCVRQITVIDPGDGDQLAIWTGADYFAEQHADEILDYLESIINAADGFAEKRNELDEIISEITSCAEDAARRLESLRRKGGVA